MKKILLVLMSVLLFIPIMVNAAECDTSKVYIDSISIDKNENVEEIEQAIAKDKTINLNLEMSMVGDNIRYKIVLKNDSEDDYELDKNNINISSDYLEYSFESDNNSNIIKAKSTKVLYLNARYKNKVPDEAFNNGVYSDSIDMKVNLSADDNVQNPNTGIKYGLIILLILLIIGISFILLRKNKKSKAVIIIIMSLIIPLSVSALCKCEIQLKAKVKIEKPEQACIYIGLTGCSPVIRSDYEKKYISYIRGTTVNDFIEIAKDEILKSKPDYKVSDIVFYFADKEIESCEQNYINDYSLGNISYLDFSRGINQCASQYIHSNAEEFLNTPTKNKNEGCYSFTESNLC